MAGMTSEGLEIKRLGEVITSLKEEAVPIFQDLVQPGDVVDTSDSSTIGRLIGLTSPSLADLWEAAQEVYWAFDPNSARGIALDNLVMYGGLSRNPASATTATVVVWGNEGVFIPATTSTVRSIDNAFYNIALSISLERDQCIGFKATIPTVVVGDTYGFTIERSSTSITINHVATGGDTKQTIIDDLVAQLASYSLVLTTSSTTDSITVESVNIFEYMSVTPIGLVISKIKNRTEVINQETGLKDQEANTITVIATPILGWDSVNNPSAGVSGRDAETDDELRLRFRDSKFLRAQNISDSLYAALLELDGVTYVGIYENETSVYDPAFDLAPHSFKPVVFGGNPVEIAQAVWRNKPLGISSQGNTTVTIFDSQGFPKDIKFERPISVPIYIDITLTVDEQNFPASGVADIKSALISYFLNNFGIGQDVIYSRLYTPINSVAGHQVDSLEIGTTPSPTGMVNIPIDFNQIAGLNTDNINITIV
jgi:uncharacterized phage protein gp47/JayE